MKPEEIPTREDTAIRTLGPGRYPTPLGLRRSHGYVEADARALLFSDARIVEDLVEEGQPLPSFEMAGARDELFFDPSTVTCGVVTCGGLCPGLNNVIRSVVMTALHSYGVKRCVGFRYGYAGLNPASGFEPVELTHDAVDHVHERGGTMLGSSRGPQDVGVMVDTLVRQGVNIMFTIGGDGTLRGASALAAEIEKRGLKIAVVGVPKTIDNDLCWVARSFGFTTAVQEARDVLQGAHTEARGTLNGVGMVKLMGRHSGFIAAHACLANHDVDFCLVPEVPEELDGEGGFLRALEERLDRRHHALIVVAEGFGQDLMQRSGEVKRDESGNLKLGDVGAYLRDRVAEHFHDRGKGVSMKYIDPSYTIRSMPACAADAEYCLTLGQHAVHAGMTGRTDMVVGFWNRYFVNLPLPMVTGRRRQIDPQGRVWLSVLDATGQRSYYRANQEGEEK